MEEDKKKKKNKKKKNKQAKGFEDSVIEKNHTSVVVEENHGAQIGEDVGVVSTGVLELDGRIGGDKDQSNGIHQALINETEKQLWAQKEAMVEEKAKLLENDRDAYIQREVVLEKKITDLLTEKNSWLQKEDSMDLKLKELLDEKAKWILKGANFEDRIKQLENDKESWIIKENSTKETIDRLTKDNMEVQEQVKVLEESRDGLLQENQQLMERILFLQSQVQHLEEQSAFSASSTTKTEQVQHATRDEDTNTPMEAAASLMEKPITENAEHVENGPELLDMFEFPEKMSNSRVQSPAIIHTEDTATVDHTDMSSNKSNKLEDSIRSYEAGQSEEIVQIPLDENQIQEVEIQDTDTEAKASVALTDAPLTGAPFRFISFVARYVSGADLVSKNNSNSGR